MLLDWIKREPAKFAAFVQAVVATALMFAVDYGLSAAIAASIGGAVALGLGWITAAVVVPTVKLSDATVERAAAMTKADIARVEATKKAGG